MPREDPSSAANWFLAAHGSRALPAACPFQLASLPLLYPLLPPLPAAQSCLLLSRASLLLGARDQIRGKEGPLAANYRAEGGCGGEVGGRPKPLTHPRFPPPLLLQPGPTRDALTSPPSAAATPAQTWRLPQVRAAAG